MPLEIHYAAASDSPTLAALNITAFQQLITNLYPEADDPTTKSIKQARLLQKLSDPDVHDLTGVDSTTGEIVAYARWTIPSQLGLGTTQQQKDEEAVAAKIGLEQSEPEQGGGHGDGDGDGGDEDAIKRNPQVVNWEVYEALKGLTGTKRRQHTREGDMILDILCVSPAHQGKGIGTKFMQWGVERADAVRSRIYLEASPEGYPLYSKFGFRVLEEACLDYASLGGAGSQRFLVMIREPQS